MASQAPNTTIIIHHSFHSITTLASYLIIPVLITTGCFLLALLMLKQKLHSSCQICHAYATMRYGGDMGRGLLEFKQERWLRDGLFHQESPFKYPVCQAGPRVCLGKEMALVEIKTVAFWLIRNYSVKLAASDWSPVPKFSAGLTATFRDGLKVVVTPKRSRSDFVSL